MLVVFLLFLTIPAVSSADPKCPEGFNLFKRVPTLKNNHTKDWCLGIFKFENMGDRDRARSFCIHHDAMLSIPENKKEFDAISKIAKKENISEPHAMDGEMASRCKAQFFQSKKAHKMFNTTIMKGECNINNKLFMFDDINTDPTFIQSHIVFTMPNRYGATQTSGEPKFQNVAQCLTLVNTNYKGNETDYAVTESSYCAGKKMDEEAKKALQADMIIDSVICGRHPL